MKTFKILTLSLFAAAFAGIVSAQSADEIIGKYVQAIGGKEKLTKLTSVYMEGTIDAMGMQGTIKVWTLNGRGQRQDMDINGSVITNCFSDKGGWSINPMMGATSAEPMTDDQYASGKNAIYIGGLFVDFAAKGYKAELMGIDSVNGVKAFKVKVSSSLNKSTIYHFDASTFFLLKTEMEAEMQGQMVENVTTYSDYKNNDGYFSPTKMEMDIAGGQFVMNFVFTKVELDKPIEESVFVKP